MLEGLHAQSAAQPDLFASIDPRAGELLQALDGLNQRYGRGTMRLAAEGQGDRAYDAKQSQGPTGAFSDSNLCLGAQNMQEY